MGTRNLTVIKSDGEYVVAQYGQWDGYPSGLGVDLLHLLAHNTPETIKAALVNVMPVSKEDVKALWASIGATDEWVDMKQSDLFKQRYPSVHRDTAGAGLLSMLLTAKQPIQHYRDLDFAADSLLCEWCYVIDLDEGVLDVHAGFNEQPLTEKDRFFFLEPKIREKTHSGTVYHPVKFKAGWLLSHLPSVAEFLAELETDEE